MAKYDAPCAGCGRILTGTPKSLPAGQRRCHPCRQPSRHEAKPPRRDTRRERRPYGRKSGNCAACQAPIWRGPGSLPEGQATCQSCRRAGKGPTHPTRTGHTRLADCAYCRSPFEAPWTGSDWRKTCSDRCRYAALGAAGGAASHRLRAPRDPRNDRVPVDSCRWKTCEICPEQFIPSYPEQRTCGRQCGVELKRRTTRTTLCEICGKDWQYRAAGRAPRHCDACRDALRQRSMDLSVPRVGRCSTCDQEFKTRDEDRTLCGKCIKRINDQEYNRTRRPGSDWDRSDRKCPACPLWFSPQYIGQTYCDAACGKKAMRKRQRQAGTRGSDLHRHRARRYGREYEPISSAKVFERDGWTCGICLRKIPKDKKVPHLLAATLDHIIPMSMPGGDHLYGNVRAAHYSCNSKRGNRGAAQLLLVG